MANKKLDSFFKALGVAHGALEFAQQVAPNEKLLRKLNEALEIAFQLSADTGALIGQKNSVTVGKELKGSSK